MASIMSRTARFHIVLGVPLSAASASTSGGSSLSKLAWSMEEKGHPQFEEIDRIVCKMKFASTSNPASFQKCSDTDDDQVFFGVVIKTYDLHKNPNYIDGLLDTKVTKKHHELVQDAMSKFNGPIGALLAKKKVRAFAMLDIR